MRASQLRTWSRADLERFPFPFTAERYRYSANIEPASAPSRTLIGAYGHHLVDADRHYVEDLAERNLILTSDPTRYAALPHMRVASWDALVTLLDELAAADPTTFSLTRSNDGTLTWRNGLLGLERTFHYGDEESLGEPPLVFAGRNIQEDVVLLDQRDHSLFVDAGIVTFAADWSFGFDVGMSYPEIHGPVPRVHAEGIVDRAHQFLKQLRPGDAYRRTNWTLTVDGRLDTSTERYDEWGLDRRSLHDGPVEDVGHRLHLRVELQHMVRLRRSGAVMFLIRTYLLPFEAIATVPEWGSRLLDVLVELPDDIADYKGLALTRGPAIAWLRDHVATTQLAAPPSAPIER